MLGDGHFKLLLNISIWESYRKKIRKNIYEERGWLFFPYSCAFDKLIFAFAASLVAQTVKNLPAMQETWVRFLSWEDPLEKEMATHSSICLDNLVERGAWQATVHGVAKSQT